jgi:HD-GYP domain-containing protein (c-di-GMP phosphodiesterase class II)
MGTVLDTRDTTTSGHSKRIADYAVKLARAINNVGYGNYSSFTFSENEIKELYYAALLHDIGKIGIREQILLKEHRIPLDRQSAICYKLRWYKEVLKSKQLGNSLTEGESFLLRNIPDIISFICEVNNKEYVSSEEAKKLKDISSLKFIDLDGIKKNILDSYELENLSVNKGNLTKDERNIINLHAEYTYNILKGIPWPSNFQSVPEIASNHHERLNGSGYYKGLKGKDISVASRILAILDVYEALTSPDRPYKELKTPEEALLIIQSEVLDGNFDPDIFKIFTKEKIYE